MTKTILTVEDSASTRRMVAVTLEHAGHKVIEAADGREGLEKALAHADVLDLILIDHNMPVMDGLTLIKTLRGMPQFATVPILMLTTESSDTMKSLGRASGATGWLVKPFDPHKLLEVVKKVIG